MDSHTLASSKEVLLVDLGWFISRFTNRLKLFFATLKGAQQANWNQECDHALIAIKQYLTEPPFFAIPEAGDILYLYLAVSEITISVALFKEDENRKQRPIFFVTKSMFKAETRYTNLEQVELAL